MALTEGQRLNIPAGVTRTSHNASTFRPYDASEATGNVNPTIPKPQKKNKCGAFGQILLAAVAIAVTIATKGATAKLFAGMGLGTTAGAGAAVVAGTSVATASAAGIAGIATAGVIGSVVSQGLGIATGIQNKFSFGAAALAGIGAGVGAGLGGMAGLNKIAGSAFLGDVARGASGSMVTQGIGVATGLQSKFSWAGVAAAGIGAGVSAGMFREMGLTPLSGEGRRLSFQNIAGNTAVGVASAMANAATRSAIEGTSFGDNIMRALPDAVGQTIGNLVAGGVAGRGRSGNTRAGDGNEIVVTGNYNLRGLGSSQNVSMIAASGAFEGSLGGGLNFGATFANVGPLDSRRAIMSWDEVNQEIVVTAPIQVSHSVASWFRTGARNPVTSNDGVQHWGGPRSSPLATIGRLGGAFGRGIVSAVSGLAQSAALGWAASSNIPVISNMARSHIMSINPVEALQAGFGHSVYIFDQGIVHDNILPAVEAGGSALVGGGIGKLSSTLGTTRLTGAAETAGGSRVIYDSPIGPVRPAEVGTPWGSAFQSSAAEALAARSAVEGGAPLYRLGTVGRSEAAEAQFWALEHPLSPGYASRYGIPPENVAKFDFIESATLKPGTSFVTRPAPGIGSNPGGGIEVVVPRNGVLMKYFGGH